MIASPLPLSRSLPVDDIPPAGLSVPLQTSPEERKALAEADGLVALPALRAALLLRQEAKGGVHVTGEVIATVTQACVVTLEPFEAEVREAVDVHFLPLAALEVWRAEHIGQPLKEDENPAEEPDLIENGRIDLGALVAEHLALGVDPYPRKPGAALPPEATVEEARVSPFAVLRNLDTKRS